MFLDAFGLLELPGTGCSLVALSFLSLFTFLIFWRIWTFTIYPRLYPDEPRTYPYWIPFIGHSLSFFSNAERTMEQARLYFNNNRAPFKLIIMGEVVYVITSAQDTNSVYKKDDYFSMNPWVVELMGNFGASPASVKAMWSNISDAEKGQSPLDLVLKGWKDKPLKEVCVKLFQTFLNPGQQSDEILKVLLGTIHDRMHWDAIPEKLIHAGQGGNEQIISLAKWSQEVLLEGATRSFFGGKLLDIQPDLFDSFFEFDENSWKISYQIPGPFAQDVQRSKKIAENAFQKYFEVPIEQRPDTSDLMKNVESAMRANGIPPKDMGVLVLMFYWVINANAWKASFWMLSEIVNNESLRCRIVDEISPYVSASTKPSSSANDLATALGQHCPTLMAVYHEALRLTAASTSVRVVTNDAVISGLKLRKGTRMVIPYRQMLLDDRAFGHDAHKFNHERFLQNPNLAKSPSFKPYGGGSTLCPGRMVAQKEILTFVALAVGKFQVRLPQQDSFRSQGVPDMNVRTPCIGIMGPVEGGDVDVVITRPQWQ
ncbi:cytochrome P450 [Aaosphaeria arxii CBS 175.79]|uniref:Cytochrome P450 n=1 Tax=Aaosphaeria arxii CBS 175.79 TaxID=1450172 RepID=A0A6A5Y4D5_9PLEO|nr:cytochrome P450 [Aaosphaeria arxii CBS 175.79]KAF2019660.1 cytochrome P450 [Aaosphaeria arxii CBS 175.79]